MSQKLLVDKWKQIENTTQFNKDFIENYSEDSDEGYFIANLNDKKNVMYIRNLKQALNHG